MTSAERRRKLLAILKEAQKYASDPPAGEETNRWLTPGEKRDRLAERNEALFDTEGAAS